jgi:type IV secretory pathway protease TraF
MTLTTAKNFMRTFHGHSDICRRSRRALRATLFLCAPFLLLYATFRFVGIRINTTSSLPRGFYIVGQSPRADLVEFCPEGEAGTISLERGLTNARRHMPRRRLSAAKADRRRFWRPRGGYRQWNSG